MTSADGTTSLEFQLEMIDDSFNDTGTDPGLNIDTDIEFSPVQGSKSVGKLDADLLGWNDPSVLSPSAMFADTVADAAKSEPLSTGRFRHNESGSPRSLRQARRSMGPQRVPATVLHRLRLDRLYVAVPYLHW